MRHFFGLILGVILAPALAYAAAWGYAEAGRSFDWSSRTIGDHTQINGAFAVMAAAGLVIGIMAAARRISPVASLLPAITYLGWSGWFLAAPSSALRLVGRVPPGGRLDVGLQALLAGGLLALVGLLLLVPALTGWREPGDEEAMAEEYY